MKARKINFLETENFNSDLHTSKIPEVIIPLPRQEHKELLWILMAGITYPDPAYRIIRNAKQPVYILEYILSGQGTLILGGKTYPIESGDAYLLIPNVPHEYHADRDKPWKKIWVNFTGSLPDALLDAFQLRGIVHYPQCPLEKEILAIHTLLRDFGAAEA